MADSGHFFDSLGDGGGIHDGAIVVAADDYLRRFQRQHDAGSKATDDFDVRRHHVAGLRSIKKSLWVRFA